MARSNKIVVPDAKQSLDNFKMEVARSLNVNLKQGYNGDLTSRQAGSVGGQMVKKMSPARTIKFTRGDRTAAGHEVEVTYIVEVDT